jgi:hypothetical protein
MSFFLKGGLAVHYTKFSELLKLSREYQMLTVTKVTGPMRPVTGNRKVARFPGNDVPFVK